MAYNLQLIAILLLRFFMQSVFFAFAAELLYFQFAFFFLAVSIRVISVFTYAARKY